MSSLLSNPPINADFERCRSATSEAIPPPLQKPLRVLVIRSVSGAGGGAEKIILRTAEHAPAMRLELTLCAIHRSQDSGVNLLERANKLNVNATTIQQNSLLDSCVLSRLREVFRSGHFDLLHSHDYKANYYALKLSRQFAIPAISTAHGWTGDLLREKYLYYPLDKRQLKRFSAVVCVSSDIRRELIRQGVSADRLHTLLNGVDPTKYNRDKLIRSAVRGELGIGTNDVVIGSAGRVEKQKRFDYLIEAVALLARHRKNVRLVLAGTGSLLEPLKELAKARGISDKCHFVGHCSDMRRLYQAFDAYVQSSEYEGTPTVLVEAMAMKLPIVATDVGGTVELVHPEKHAIVVPPHQVDAIVEAVATTIDNPAATQCRVAAARERVEGELSIKHRTRRLIEIYNRVLEQSDERLTTPGANG